jgi:PAS domain S-box-containing protein
LENKFQQQIEELTRVNQKLKLEIIDLKETEQVLRERETSFKRAQQMGEVGSWEWDIKQNKTIWSDELYHIFGVKPEQFDPNAYERFLNCIYTEDRQLVQETIEKTIIENNSFSIEYRIVRPDGIVRNIHARGEVVCDETGNPIKMVGTSQDLTERKQAEERFHSFGICT